MFEMPYILLHVHDGLLLGTYVHDLDVHAHHLVVHQGYIYFINLKISAVKCCLSVSHDLSFFQY